MMARAGGARELKHAVALHAKGDLAAAERAYKAMLRREPRQWRAHYLLGTLLDQRGELDAARVQLEEAVSANPSGSEARMGLAATLRKLGMSAEAYRQYEEVVRIDPRHALAHFMLGHAAEQARRWRQAEIHYEAAVTSAPDLAAAWNNLGNVHRAQERYDDALISYQRAIAANPTSAELYDNLGTLYDGALARWNEALVCFQKAVELDPSAAMPWFHLGSVLTRLNSHEKALEHYARALELKPDFAQVYSNLGLIFFQQGFLREARACYERAIEADSALPDAHNNLGWLLNFVEQFQQAEQHFRLALEHRPDYPEALNGLASTFIEQGRLDEAIQVLHAALALQPRLQEAAVNLGRAHQMLDQLDEARAAFLSAATMRRNDGLQVRAATVIPQIMGSRQEIQHNRAQLERALDELLDRTLSVDESELLKYHDTPFYLAYHGENDRTLLEKFAAVYAQACPELLAVAPHCVAYQGPQGRPIRIAFVSRFFGNHSVGRFFNPIIERLAQLPEFEVTVFSISTREDEVFKRLLDSCQAHVALPYSLREARALIGAREQDILVYTDVGMDAFSYLLAFARLAPAQCLLHGHSVTSGIPALDYFISSRLLEPEDGQMQFTEQLILLDSLMMYLEPWRPPEHVKTRAELGLPEGARVYLCPMKLQKMHPDMDRAFGEILRRDADACIVVYEDDRRSDWGERLRARLHRSLGEDAKRVRFLPWGTLDQLMSAMLNADVVLDSFHHGGATTANICLSLGIPMVTWPGPTSRGRGLLAYYQLLGIPDCVATTQADFVDLAVRAAGHPQWRRQIGQRILAALPRLHVHDDVFAQYAQAFRSVASDAVNRSHSGRVYPGGRRYFERVAVSACPDGWGEVFRSEPGAMESTVLPRYTDENDEPARLQVQLPPRFGVRIDNAEIFGGSTLALKDSRALMDLSAHPGFDRFDYRSGSLQHVDRASAVIHTRQGAMQELEAGILLTGRVSANYFHWMIEYLPRLALVADLSAVPLLVDEGVVRAPQLQEALAACAGTDSLRVVPLRPGFRYRVRQLTYLSTCSWIPTEYRSGEPIRAADQALDPVSVGWIRARLSGLTQGASTVPTRRLYLSRRQSGGGRRMLNEHEVEAAFVESGFEIVRPETLTLAEQARLFAEAVVIAGASGAAMTNLLFCLPETRVLCLMPKEWREFALFSSLASILNQHMAFVDGEVQPGTSLVPYQCDYTIDIRALCAQLAAWR